MSSGRTAPILDRILAGQRLSPADAVTLLEEGNLLALGAAANTIRNRRNDPAVATYIVDRNINYTNVCVYRCQFCAFYRPSAEHPEAYTLSHEQIGEKIQETIELGGTGILLQGGVHAGLPFSFYEEMFRFIRSTFPTIHLHALSAPEVYFLQKITKWPMEHHFRKEQYTEGVVVGVGLLGDELAKHFPRSEADRDELPNTIDED